MPSLESVDAIIEWNSVKQEALPASCFQVSVVFESLI